MQIIQGYPQRMRLQRRLEEIHTAFFFILISPCNYKLVSFFVKLLNMPFNDHKAKYLIQSWKHLIQRVPGRLYSLVLCDKHCTNMKKVL